MANNLWTLWGAVLLQNGEESEDVPIRQVDPFQSIHDLKILVRDNSELGLEKSPASMFVLCKFHTRAPPASTFTKLDPRSVISNVLQNGDTIIAFSIDEFKKLCANNRIVSQNETKNVPTVPASQIATTPKPSTPPDTKTIAKYSTKRILTVSPASFHPTFDSMKIKFVLNLKDIGGTIGSGDWVGLYSTRASSNKEHLTYNYIQSIVGTSQTDQLEGYLATSFMNHLPGGQYEFRYFPNNNYECLGVSNPITKLFFEDYTRVFGYQEDLLSLKQLCIRDIAVKSNQDSTWHKKLKSLPVQDLPNELIDELLFACEVVCGGITDELFRMFMSASLNSLYLKYSSGISDETWKNLHMLAPNLSSITLDQPVGTEPQLVSMLEGIGPKLKNLSILQHTDLTDKFLSAVKQCCFNLVSFSISEAVILPPACLEDLGHYLPNLTTLIANSMPLTDKDVSAMLMGKPRLIKLSLDRCTLITDGLCTNLVKLCPLLKELSLGATTVSNATVEKLLGLQHLESLELPGCFLIDDEVVIMFHDSTFLKHARRLSLGGTSLTEEGKRNLRELFATLPTDLNLEDINIRFGRSKFRIGEKLIGSYILNDVTAVSPWLGLHRDNSLDNEYIASMVIKKRTMGEFSFDTSPCIEGNYEVRYFKESSSFASSARFPFTVEEATTSAASLAKMGLQAFPKIAKPGSKVVCMLTKPDLLKDSVSLGAWVGMYRVGTSHSGYMTYQYFPQGQFQLFFQAPTVEGMYEFRFVTFDSTNALAYSEPWFVRNN